MGKLPKLIICFAALAGIAGIVGILLTAEPEARAENPSEPCAESSLPSSTQDTEPVPPEKFVSPPATESEWPMENATVIDLMSGILQARDRADRAWLARTMESTSAKESLVEDDLLAAYRQYLWKSTDGLWGKVSQAWQARTYEVDEDGDKAELVLQVEGSLGEVRLPFVRIDGAWYFAGI